MSKFIEKVDNFASTAPLYNNVIFFGISIKKMYNFNSVFKKIRKIGEGAQGKVYKYQNLNSGEYVAIKNQDKLSKRAVLSLMNEFYTHQDISNLTDSVTKVYDYFIYEDSPKDSPKDTPNEYNFAIVMELIQGYDMKTYVKNLKKCGEKINEKTFITIASWLTSTIGILHNNGFVHRDIKLANILMDPKKKRLVLIDFGLSNSIKTLNNINLSNTIGTPYYMSPESTSLVFNVNNGADLSKLLMATDLWAMGITLYLLVEKRMPWSPNITTKNQLFDELNDSNYEIKFNYHNNHITDTISKILERNYLQRPKTEEILLAFLKIGEKLHEKNSKEI